MSISRLMQVASGGAVNTAWTLNNVTIPPYGFFSVATEETDPRGVFFKPDGTKMYVIGFNGDDVNEYDLSTAWDISTASYLQNFSFAVEETIPTSVFFKPDGTKMYVIGADGDDVNEYNLSTAWDISTASYLQNFSVAVQDTSPTGLFFKPDGLKMYVAGSSGDDVNEYNLSTAWDISTASYLQNFSVSAQDTVPVSVFFKPDGLKMYVVGGAGDDVNEYDLSTAWNIFTASYLQNFSVAAQDVNPQVVFFKPDGTKMYVAGSSGSAVYEYDLSTAWNISTASYLQNFSVSAQDTSPTSVFFKPDGLKMYVAGNAGDAVYEYNLSTAWDISTASWKAPAESHFRDVGTEDVLPTGVFFKPDGLKMYVVGGAGDDVNEYDLSTAWDISTASYVQNFSVAAEGAIPEGVFFKPDGTKMYVIDSGGDAIWAYSLI